MWPEYELSRIATIVGGGTPKREKGEYWSGDIPWVTPTDLPAIGASIVEVSETKDHITEEGLERSSARLVPAGSVLLSSRASIGKIAIAGVPLCTNQGFATLIPKPCVDSRYLAYALQVNVDAIGGLAGSTTFKEVPKSALKKFRLPLPPLSEQRRIVEILDQADHLRRLRTEANAKVDRILPALFLKMFGDPATNPMGWPTVALGGVLEAIEGGWSPKCHSRAARNGEWGVLKLGAVTWCTYRDQENKALPGDAEPKPELEVKSGDILFARKNTHALVGACALVHATRPRLMIPDLIFRLRIADSSNVFPEYLAFLLGRTSMRTEIQKLASGAAGSMPNISRGRLVSAEIPVPPLEAQHGFSSRYRRCIEIETWREESYRQVDSLLARLRSKAFSGELTARWRESRDAELRTELEAQAAALQEAQ